MTEGRSYRIREAVEADLPVISSIYNHYVETSTCTFALEPWTPEEYEDWLRDRSRMHPVTVAEWLDDGRPAVGAAHEGSAVVAWGALAPWKNRRGYARTVEASVYVHPDHLRKGMGSSLLSDLIERARDLGHRTLLGGTCTEHPGSLALQASLGFVEVGVLKDVGYKFGRWLDVMHTQLIL